MIWVAIAGFALLVGSVAGASMGEIHPLEQRAFHLVNGLPNWLYWPLWLPMQLGNLVVGTLAGLGLAVWFGDLAMAVGVVSAAALKLLAERVVRKRTAQYIEVRQRPGRASEGPSSAATFPRRGPASLPDT